MTPVETQIVKALDQVFLALVNIEKIVEDIVDPQDARLVALVKAREALYSPVMALHFPHLLSTPSQPDKEATAPAGDANQAAPEFASHSVGDLVELADGRRGVIGGIDRFGIATVNMQYGDSIHHDLCALKNLSR